MVELHRSHIMEKLQVHSVAELIRLVIERRNAGTKGRS
jgi:FixJ family two-component response regulator